MKQTVLVLVTRRLFAKSLATHREKCLCIGKKWRKEMLAGIITRQNERQLNVCYYTSFSVSESSAPSKKKNEKSTFAVQQLVVKAFYHLLFHCVKSDPLLFKQMDCRWHDFMCNFNYEDNLFYNFILALKYEMLSLMPSNVFKNIGWRPNIVLQLNWTRTEPQENFTTDLFNLQISDIFLKVVIS